MAIRQQKMVTDEELHIAWGNANFGPRLNAHRMDVPKFAVLKCASGYYQGHTSKSIAQELGLIKKSSYTLTKRGQFCLYEWFHGDSKL